MMTSNEIPELYHNPILPGFHPDPSICRAGEDYFIVNSSFAYFPGVPLFHSRDLVNWRQVGHCLTRPSQLPLEHARPSGGIFAPSIRFHEGTFYMITTNVTRGGNFYVTARDPFGEWSDPVWLKQGGIDPSLLFDQGHVYMTSTGFSSSPENPKARIPSIQQSEIDIANGNLLTEPRPIWNGTGGSFPEGPHLYHIDGWYYLMIAEGGTEFGHTEVIARSRSPWGPFESCPNNPILTHRSYDSSIQALGHADLVEAQDGSWWLVCLGIRTVGYPPAHHLGRETFLAPVQWNANGWPEVGLAGRIKMEMESPHLTPVKWAVPAERDDFDGTRLGLKWNFLGNPGSEDWSLTRQPGSLGLRGTPATLDDGLDITFVGCRQEHFNVEIAAELNFDPAVDKEEAGLTVWMDERHHYEVFLSRVDGKRLAAVRRRIGSLAAVVAQEEIPAGPVTLRVRANQLFYAFSIETRGAGSHLLATGETRYLTTEVASGFTGVYFGLYASGSGQSAADWAFFDWFDYRSLDQQKGLSIDSPLADLFENDKARAVLNKFLPELTVNPFRDWPGSISLIGMEMMSPGGIAADKLLSIDDALRELPQD